MVGNKRQVNALSEQLGSRHSPTCLPKEEPQKGCTNNLPFSEMHIKTTLQAYLFSLMDVWVSLSEPFTHLHIAVLIQGGKVKGGGSLESVLYFGKH